MENFIDFFLTNHFGVNLVLLCIFSSELKDYIKRLHEGNKDPKLDKHTYILNQTINLILLIIFIIFIIIDYSQPQYDVAKYFYLIATILFCITWLWPIDKDD